MKKIYLTAACGYLAGAFLLALVVAMFVQAAPQRCGAFAIGCLAFAIAWSARYLDGSES